LRRGRYQLHRADGRRGCPQAKCARTELGGKKESKNPPSREFQGDPVVVMGPEEKGSGKEKGGQSVGGRDISTM